MDRITRTTEAIQAAPEDPMRQIGDELVSATGNTIKGVVISSSPDKENADKWRFTVAVDDADAVPGYGSIVYHGSQKRLLFLPRLLTPKNGETIAFTTQEKSGAIDDWVGPLPELTWVSVPGVITFNGFLNKSPVPPVGARVSCICSTVNSKKYTRSLFLKLHKMSITVGKLPTDYICAGFFQDSMGPGSRCYPPLSASDIQDAAARDTYIIERNDKTKTRKVPICGPILAFGANVSAMGKPEGTPVTYALNGGGREHTEQLHFDLQTVTSQQQPGVTKLYVQVCLIRTSTHPVLRPGSDRDANGAACAPQYDVVSESGEQKIMLYENQLRVLCGTNNAANAAHLLASERGISDNLALALFFDGAVPIFESRLPENLDDYDLSDFPMADGGISSAYIDGASSMAIVPVKKPASSVHCPFGGPDPSIYLSSTMKTTVVTRDMDRRRTAAVASAGSTTRPSASVPYQIGSGVFLKLYDALVRNPDTIWVQGSCEFLRPRLLRAMNRDVMHALGGAIHIAAKDRVALANATLEGASYPAEQTTWSQEAIDVIRANQSHLAFAVVPCGCGPLEILVTPDNDVAYSKFLAQTLKDKCIVYIVHPLPEDRADIMAGRAVTRRLYGPAEPKARPMRICDAPRTSPERAHSATSSTQAEPPLRVVIPSEPVPAEVPGAAVVVVVPPMEESKRAETVACTQEAETQPFPPARVAGGGGDEDDVGAASDAQSDAGAAPKRKRAAAGSGENPPKRSRRL
jgi:hypothetical protein